MLKLHSYLSNELKSSIAVVLANVSRLYFYYMPFVFGKKIIWDLLLSRYVNWRGLLLIAKTRQGICYKINTRDIIQSYIYYFGIWEPIITNYMCKNLSPGDTFIDIGANVGYYSCLVSKIVGNSGRVYAIEASPSTYNLLMDNINLNGLKNITAINKAVFHEERKVVIYKPYDWNIGAATIDPMNAELTSMKDIEAEVDGCPLQQMINVDEIYKAKIIKIDVEGAEWFIIRSLKDIIKKCSPMTEWILEINPETILKHGGTVAELIDIFKENNYKAYIIENSYDVEWYFKQHAKCDIKEIDKEINTMKDIIFKRNV